MIVIRTLKFEKATDSPVYKEYYCTTGVKAGMGELNHDRNHNDLNVYSPTQIVDVWDTEDSGTLVGIVDDYCLNCPDGNDDTCGQCHVRKMMDYYMDKGARI